MDKKFLQGALEQALKHKGEFNEITLYPHNMNDIGKILKCNKCKEKFVLLLETERQGDLKLVPVWIILEDSGIKQLKDNMRVCYREKYICTFGKNDLKPDVENAIDHYDDYALKEMENKRCVMKDCDGTLDCIYDRDDPEEAADEDNKSISTKDTNNTLNK